MWGQPPSAVRPGKARRPPYCCILRITEEGEAKNLNQSAGLVEERERIRRQNMDEFKRLCERIGGEAQARGLTEEILNEILSERANCRGSNSKPSQNPSVSGRNRKDFETASLRRKR
jgi:hypothetical protein